MSGVLFHQQILASNRPMATLRQLYNLYIRHQDLTTQEHNIINVLKTKLNILDAENMKITYHIDPPSSCEHCRIKEQSMAIELEINILRAELKIICNERIFVETTMELQKKIWITSILSNY